MTRHGRNKQAAAQRKQRIFNRALIGLGAMAIGSALPAFADGGDSLPGSGAISFERVLIHLDGATTLSEASDLEQNKYFNLAHCLCDASGPAEAKEREFAVELKLTATQNYDVPGEIWIGSSCDSDATTRQSTCTQQSGDTIADIDNLTQATNVTFSVRDLIFKPDETTCVDDRQQAGTIWVMVDADKNGTYDYDVSKAINYDTKAPAVPTGFSAQGAESAVTLEWTATEDDDTLYYQVLCAKTDGTPAFDDAPVEAQYQTENDLCGLPVVKTLKAITVDVESDGADAQTLAAPLDSFAQMDNAFLCGTASSTATSIRIDGLENGVSYYVAFLAIDEAGNASGGYVTTALTPQPATDFWEDLHDQGSGVQGGYCLIADTYGDNHWLTQALRGARDGGIANLPGGHAIIRGYYQVSAALAPWLANSVWLKFGIQAGLTLLLGGLALALLVAAGTITWALQRAVRRIGQRLRGPDRAPAHGMAWLSPRLAASLVMAGSLGAASLAQAQHADEYWRDDHAEEESYRGTRWLVGLKLGPYVPAIDAQLGDGKRPFHQMFGGYNITPMLEIDWVFSQRFGQLAVGGSLGYYGKSAYAWLDGTSPDDENRARSDSDKNSFRLIPARATLTYRLTQLDDDYGIPLVPYLRGGLGYYLWWVKAPSGNTAVEIPDDCASSSCYNRARGGTLGLVGSVGIAIRAEQIDSDAATTMRLSGIQHAGFYVEYEFAKVDGFGAADKLAVGDSTWYAGVNFEF